VKSRSAKRNALSHFSRRRRPLSQVARLIFALLVLMLLTAYYRLLWNIGCLASEDSTLQGFKTFKPGSGLESSRPEKCLAEGYAKLLIKLGANN